MNALTHKAGWLVVSQVGCRGPRGSQIAQGLRVEQYDRALDAFRRSAEVNSTPKEVDLDRMRAVQGVQGARRRAVRTLYQVELRRVTDDSVGGNLARAVRAWKEVDLADLGVQPPPVGDGQVRSAW